jgi:excisionase family DNA binding protein
LDIAAVAEQLCVTERHVRRLVAERRIPYVKVGRFVRFDPTDIADWISAARIPVRGLSYPMSMIDADRSSRVARAPGSGSRR